MSDLIDRQEVLKLFPKYDYKHACFDLCNAIKDMPSAQPQSTMGQLTDAAQSTKDCISRQAAIDVLAEWGDPAIVNRLNNLPSAQPEIVRCKDCKHIVAEKYDGITSYYCEMIGICCARDDFCSYAERRQNG